MNDEEFNMERMLARSQLLLSVLFIAGYFGLIACSAMKLIDSSFQKDLTPFVGIVVYYWFQRQRPHTAVDGTVDTGSKPVPTQPVNPAQPLEKAK